MTFTLNAHNFLTSVTASTVTPWVPLDWKYAGIQQRVIAGTRETTASDQVIVEMLISSLSSNGTQVDVISTATAWTGAGNQFSAIIQGPAQAIRVRKTGASAAATVNGLI